MARIGDHYRICANCHERSALWQWSCKCGTRLNGPEISREYSIRRTQAYRLDNHPDAAVMPSQFAVDMAYTVDGETSNHGLGYHKSYECAIRHARHHNARILPMEGGKYEPYDCEICVY